MQNIPFQEELILVRSFTSMDEFVREYKRLFREEVNCEELYLLLLTELEKAISEGNIDGFKKLCDLIDYTKESVKDQATLRDYYDNINNPLRNTNLVIVASKYNKLNILQYLLEGGNEVLNNLSIGIGRTAISPEDEDKATHNAFYYAIRAENLQLLVALINEWPDNVGKLDEILSRAYEELKLKKVPLSDEIEMYVENKLMDLRFFSNPFGQSDESHSDDFNNIRERIELLLRHISLLKRDYSNTEKVNARFLFVIKSIAQNIHVLKRQVKSTYDKFPWEELEFCLVIFVSSRTKLQELNLFYRATLNTRKLLNYLGDFAEKLEDEKVNIKGDGLRYLPSKTREEAAAEIISGFPKFEELYNDYQEIRDIYSLQKIGDYINLALSADPTGKEGQLIIIRALQVIGEHLKNTLESPKLSLATSRLLVILLPKNASKIIVKLRDSISHADSLSKRMEIEKNADLNFFINIQNDIKTIGGVIVDMLYKNKLRTIELLLQKIKNSENKDELKEVLKELSAINLDELVTGNFKTLEHEDLEKLVQELRENIAGKTNYEEDRFNRINSIISCGGTQSKNMISDYITGFVSLQGLSVTLNDNRFDDNLIQVMKFYADETLQKITAAIEPHGLEEIANLSIEIVRGAESGIPDDHEPDKVKSLLSKIISIAKFGTHGVKWIDELRENLNIEKGSKLKNTDNVGKEKKSYNDQLAMKLSELKVILTEHPLSGPLTEALPAYKMDKKLQAVVEMLVLDIMSILDSSKPYLENNLFFLDDHTSLLSGKCLRNYLAHHNAVADILLSDPSRAVFLNARKLTEENVTMTSERKIGKFVSDDPIKLREKIDQILNMITNQERMFGALEEGNLEGLKECLRKGADMKARSVGSWSTLHFAAKGHSLEVLKYLLDQNLSVNVKDNNGHTPLHIAAAHGRDDVIDLLVKDVGVFIDSPNNRGKTPLHVAVQNGHKDTVKVLLKNNANAFALDISGLSPLHYSINNNHIDIAKILLGKNVNFNTPNETMRSWTPLYLAAGNGQLELVNFLLQNNADVNAKNSKNCTPLHVAAFNGCLKIVNALILKGADVNATSTDGRTTLHSAAENGNKQIVNVLLKHGANVNAVEKTYNITPLQYAALYGHTEIVKELLKNKADVNIANIDGETALHSAVERNHLKTVDILLEHGGEINAKSVKNATPLYYAARFGHKEVIQFLVKNGAKINVRDNNNLTALHVAAFEGFRDIVDFLIENHAEVNARNNRGETPLHSATQNGSKDVIDLLIRSKSEVNARDLRGFTPLHVAAWKGSKDIVDFLITNKADINAVTDAGFVPLTCAIKGNHTDIVNLLIQNKAQVDIECIDDDTLLITAIREGNKDIVEALITNGANVNDKNPLLYAIRFNHKEIVEILIANGANVNVNEALSMAVVSGYLDIVEILLKNKADVNKKDSQHQTPLHLAAKEGHKRIVNVLIRRRADVNARGVNNLTALGFAAQEGHEKVVEILITGGAEVNVKFDKDVTPLHLAARNGHKKAVDALIKRGADVEAASVNNITPLWFAAQEGHEKVVEILTAAGANVNVKSDAGVTPLHMAAKKGHGNVVKVLVLDNQANINVKDDKNRTPVELAVRHGHLHVVKMLVKTGKIDINAKGNNDFTLLHVASQGSNLELINYLINKGSDVNAKTSSGDKSVHIAAKKGYKDVVEFFLGNGLNVNDAGELNLTILHCAAMKGHLELVNYLILQGADVNARDTNGVTPMQHAANYNYKDVFEVLLQNGAINNAN